MSKKDNKIIQITPPDNVVKTNNEFLFIYDAKLTNPNGDPDNENKPRMDEEREINLVSDVRLKRYIRDYLQQYKKENIYVTKLNDTPVTPEEVLNDLKKRKDTLKFKDDTNAGEFYLKNLIDVRMFGATMAIQNDTKTFTGPIQINWGYSLNPVSLVESNTITTHFKSKGGASQSSIGKDYRVKYSLIAFYGNIIANRAWDDIQKTGTLLTYDDIALFDDAIINSIPLMATRSKIGQYPRLYIRIEYNTNSFLLGDFRYYVKFNAKSGIKKEEVRNVDEVVLDLVELQNVIEKLKKDNYIKNIKVWRDDKLETIIDWDKIL